MEGRTGRWDDGGGAGMEEGDAYMGLLNNLFLSLSVIPAMKRFSLGLLCLVIYAIFSPHYPDSYYLTDEYDVRKPCFCTSIPDAFNITDLKPKPHFHTLFCLTNVTVQSQMRPCLFRPSRSGTAVSSSSFGPKSSCTNMLAAGS